MKKILCVFLTFILLCTSCGSARNAKKQTNDSGIEETKGLIKSRKGIRAFLDKKDGVYVYKRDGREGCIKITDGAYSEKEIIGCDSENNSGFCAYDSYVEYIEDGCLYLKYIAMAYADGYERYTYYTLQFDKDTIEVSECSENYTDPQVLFKAKKTDKDITEAKAKRITVLPKRFSKLNVKSVKYKKRFELAPELKGAIEQLMIFRNSFDSRHLLGDYPIIFLDCFIRSSNYSFSYLDRIVKDNSSDLISWDNLDYISFSLTGHDLQLERKGDGIEAFKNPFFEITEYQRIVSYKVLSEGDVVKIKAKYEAYDIKEDKNKPCETGYYYVTLVKNKYSCFDGYSIVQIEQKNAKILK